METSMEFMGRPWFHHALYASLAFPSSAKAWGSMESMGIFLRSHHRAWISMETTGHHLLVILNSMERHGKHGTLFSRDFRQHGKAWGAW